MRILIATATAGGGHLAAAAALAEAWRGLHPEDTVEQVDIVKFFSPLHRKIHAEGYVKLVEHAPEIWGLVFARTDNPKLAAKLSRLQRAFPSSSRLRFTRFVKQFKPDVVLCTHYAPLEPLAGIKADSKPSRRRASATSLDGSPGAGPFVVSIVTDFEAHALWMGEAVDLYCVAAEETKARLVARGAPDERVVATGIPLAAKFSSKPDVKEITKRMGLRDDLPVVLVLSGGFGMGPVGEILEQLDKVERKFQTVVVTGRNQDLRRDLAGADRAHPTHVLGFAGNMHELFAIADIVITKPGGLTSSEALAMGKPLFILNPIPGQEAANSDFLLERGAAVKVNRVEDLPFRLDQLLGTKKLDDLSKAAKRLGKPAAALDICREVQARLEKLVSQGRTEAVGRG